MKTVDVIIPTYRPTDKLEKIIERLNRQTYKVNKIILINTEKKYFLDKYGREDYFDKYGNVLVKHISQMEFDHAATRAYGVLLSDADFFICMTDDALPLNTRLVEKLLEPILAGKASISYGRQCASRNSSEIEKYSRKFNYPDVTSYKSIEDKERLGIKIYFFSDVCAAYTREVYNELGGFVKKAIFNEDMIFASKVINSGRVICYASDAMVLHSHSYSPIKQLMRNFDLGASQAMNPEVFANLPSAGEGMKLVKGTISHLIRKKKIHLIIDLIIISGFKFAGFYLGKRFRKLPKFLVKKLTMNKIFWKHFFK